LPKNLPLIAAPFRPEEVPMPKHREEFALPLPLPDALAACRAALAGPGWTVAAQGADRLTCREIAQMVSWGNPATVEVALAATANGGTRVALAGSNGGFGPIQSNHLKGRLAALREAIEQAAARPAGPQTFSRGVVVNGERVSDETLAGLEAQHGLRVGDGDYWYDKVSGAWGSRGGPARGFVPPGMPLGGPLRQDASGGGTGVVINGRELHPLDVMALRQLVQMVLPGRWWTDAAGNFGWEGGPVLGNLWALYWQARGGGGGGGDGTRGGTWGTSMLNTDASGQGYFNGTDMFGKSYTA
jgi:hypothetical protein